MLQRRLLGEQVETAGRSPGIKKPLGRAAVLLLTFELLPGGSATRICGDLMALIEAGNQFRQRHHCQTFETFLAYWEASNVERDRTMFQIVVSELDRDGNVIRRRPTQPLYEIRETAMAMAEFDALRLSEECRVSESDDCIRATDIRGRTFKIEVKEVASVEFAV